MITWNGITSDSLDIIVEECPNYVKPERKYEAFPVPGRNGDLIVAQKAWGNVEQPYTIVAGDGTLHSVPGAFSDVASWLYAPDGYCRLSDGFDATHYREACFVGPFDIENMLTRTGRAEIIFNCKPQRFLLTGEVPVTYSLTGQTITNPTAFHARPLIRVHGGGLAGTVTVNGTVFTISDTSSDILIDCETMNCTDTNGANKNSIVSSSTSEFATLKPGDNSIGFTGGVINVEITPRWWEL